MGGIFNFFKVKKNSLDVFLSKKLSVEDKLNYALTELDKRAFKYKESLIELVARRDSVHDLFDEMNKKYMNARDQAADLKKDGKESLAKSKIVVMLSYEQAAKDLEKSYSELTSKADECKKILINIEAKKEILAAQAEIIKTKASTTGVNISIIDFEDISKIIRGVEIDVNAREEVENVVAASNPGSIVNESISSEEIEKAYKDL
jgi:phage shock protein A